MNAKDNERKHTYLGITHGLNSSPFSQCWQSWFHRETIVRNLEFVQDLVVVSLCIGLFCVMLIRLGEMFLSLLEPINFQAITSDILFILILVEIFRLLVIYLQEQRISIGAAVEVSLVSALREIILEGVLEVPLDNLLGACVFLVVLGGLLFLRVWMFQQFDAVKQANNGKFLDSQDSKSRRASVVEHYPF
ncbi:phosphate-starvation-inducible PsiE family protein [Thermocoleostomius sinensis]|uniref:Phosphate-starvation-inducible PsiE family protein n=1 Tax=Thermocoleostomius sinensis A174 TaxID=2016057 RepID=A0A9E9C6K5_9CYAN|nr:phosphate-starvation-inducible PsiE family protein [Thermocoleostomius sinensis]WAL58293.1 phosphate-starvation-inducible PsiE family protein [Thermocoleostomius sinensis A174]